MFEETQEKNDRLKQVLKEMDQKPTEYVELPDSTLANIVGGSTVSRPLRSVSVPMFIF